MTFSQCLVKIDSILLLLMSRLFLTTTTISFPESFFCFNRKLSLIILFNLFLATALRICFFGTAKPRRANSKPLLFAKNKKDLSLERRFEEKTCLYSSGFLNLLSGLNLFPKEGTYRLLLGRKFFSSFRSSGFYNCSSGTSLHTSTKTVVSFSFQITGLKSSFHNLTAFVFLCDAV